MNEEDEEPRGWPERAAWMVKKVGEGGRELMF